ncbi:MAG: FAD:protein FMN transferase [Opitutales bacterium]
MERRKFIAYAIGGVGLSYAGWRSTGGRRMKGLTLNSQALGTKVAITVFHPDKSTAAKAIQAAFDAIDKVEQHMSLYQNESQLSRLNRTGRIENPHPELVRVLRTATRISQRTGGAFDVTVQPLWKLYSENSAQGTLPTESDILEARSKVDWRRIEISDTEIRLKGDGTLVTLNGIAQGYAADAAYRALREHNVEHALIDSGEIGSYGTKPDKENWTIGIRHPRKQDELLGLAGLENRCLATSGDYETRFSEDYKNNHLFDPRTGHSPVETASVSVAAKTALEADALSTAAFILGPEKGIQLIQTTTGADALFVYKNGRVTSTAGFPLLDSMA